MLIWLGYDVTTNGIGMNRWRWGMSVTSIIALLVFTYVKPNLEPLFFETGWSRHRWICYPYAAYLLLWLVHCVYKTLSQKVVRYINMIGKASYEIFLVQMIFTTINFASFLSAESKMITTIFNFTLAWALSIYIGMAWHRYKLR